MTATLSLLLWAWTAAATPVEHAAHDPHAAAEHAAHDPHAAAEHAGGAHGEHHDPWADEDRDQTPSWMDPTAGDAPNEGYAIKKLAYHGINLAILFGVLFYFGRKPVASFIATRADTIRRDVRDAATLKADAEAKHAALLARIEAFDAEIRAIEEDAHARAAEEEAKLKARAERAAAQILENAQRQIREESSRIQGALRAEAVELAVALAERTLRESVVQDDHRRLAAQFLDTVRSGEVTHG